jgi:hypothetical protein
LGSPNMVMGAALGSPNMVMGAPLGSPNIDDEGGGT